MIRIQSYTDKFAIGLSVLCSIHCLLLPVVMLLVPSLAALSIADDELFHKWMIAGVLPISLFALTMGCRKHGKYTFLALGSLGVVLLSLAAFWGHELVGESGEKYITLASSFLIALAHFNNHRLCQKKHCC
ncbi:MAG: MerC domain-containing protein [Oligoflexales bacterium]